MHGSEPSISPADPAVLSLALARRGDCGVVIQVGAADHDLDHGVARSELERRLLEIGFVEGARFAVLHEGLIGRDPMALQLDDMRVALRRREAVEILVRLDAPPIDRPVARPGRRRR